MPLRPMKSEATNPQAGATPDRSDGHPGERLDGWKAIASYLGRDIRTVQRWELSEQLPIRRLEHKHRASAYAFTAELDAWLAARTAHDGDLPPELTAPRVQSRRWRLAARDPGPGGAGRRGRAGHPGAQARG